MSMIFGDDEPEDAWDATDDVRDQIRNLFRRMFLVDHQPEPVTTDPHTRLRMLEQRVELARLRRLAPHDEHRILMIVDDIGFVRGRLP